jgi:hypothetical protein
LFGAQLRSKGSARGKKTARGPADSPRRRVALAALVHAKKREHLRTIHF